MNLERIQLHNFRNYHSLELELDPGVNLLVGDNAQGKTNLLEAIGYLGSGRSFRFFTVGFRLKSVKRRLKSFLVPIRRHQHLSSRFVQADMVSI